MRFRYAVPFPKAPAVDPPGQRKCAAASSVAFARGNTPDGEVVVETR
jgi:hypothetical protein